ncbi:MAG: MGH1-like glycoside hydrolase domain-containing protein [Streptosporangiaceae bacterium]
MGAERDRVAGFGRLDYGLRQAGDWYRWGPYVSERQWGTVREDYSASGDAWDYLSHDQARSRAYRWGEDGLAGFCDIHQRLCVGLALWNGADPILKERLFGLTSGQGNHGEDAKEYWWYTDAIPSHAWNSWRYHYPQARFPYAELIAENGSRNRSEPEFELLDTGAFDGDRFWIVEVDYAKAGPDDLLIRISVTNAGPEPATVHVLPTAWFRNTWAWGEDAVKPSMAAQNIIADAPPTWNEVAVRHPFVGEMQLLASSGPDGRRPKLLFCENETNTALLFATNRITPYPKDGIGDHVIDGAATINPAQTGTKCSSWYQLTLADGESAEVRLRLRPRGIAQTSGQSASGAPAVPDPIDPRDALGADFDRVIARRQAEAEEFYAELTPHGATADEAMIMRRAFAGMLWCKQLYYYDVARWLDGDPAQPPPPPERLTARNSRWRSFDAFDIMSMPDKWEYPWFAAWDLAFHCVALAHVDPAFAKYQLILICREWFQHPSGALPAYEWDFGDVNPPVQAWAALEVFAIDGGRDIDFLSRVFDKLLLNFTWWVNREDAEGNNLFEGGFLGLDNIGPIDRSHLPVGGILEQSDATGWMGFYAMAMASIALVLHRSGQRPGTDLMMKFLEHFAAIRDALDSLGLWDEADGIYYDRLITPSGDAVPLKVRSVAGMIPALALGVVDQGSLERSMAVGKRFAGILAGQDGIAADALGSVGMLRGEPGHQRLLLSLAGPDKLARLLTRLFDEGEFLSPHGLRALSAWHREHPYAIDIEGYQASIDYEPAESTTPLFGGNSNWRGPIWFPVNYLVISALERYHTFFGDDLTIEYPTGSGRQLTLDQVAADLSARLISIFARDANGRRPCFGGTETLQSDPAWRDNLLFSEYFQGDNGAGLGASHQTGWTGLVADLIRRKYGAVRSTGEVIAEIASHPSPNMRL